MADYAYEMQIGYKPQQEYGEIQNYREACSIATKVISERFDESDVSPFNAFYEREVFYDLQSDTWLVYISPASDDWLGGGYSCIVSSNGTVISCWGD